MPALAEPVLTLALGNLEKLNSINSEISTIWGVFTKCKDNLQNGHRLENLSWRLWYRSCHSPSNQDCKSVLTKPLENDLFTQRVRKAETATAITSSRAMANNIPSAADNLISTNVPINRMNVLGKTTEPTADQPTKTNTVVIVKQKNIDLSIDNNLLKERELEIKQQTTKSINPLLVTAPTELKPMPSIAPMPVPSLAQREKILEAQRSQLQFLQSKIKNDIDQSVKKQETRKNPTFFIGDSDSDCSYSDSEDSIGSESESEIEDQVESPKLFEKANNLNISNKRPSLLSVALLRNEFRKVQSEVGISSTAKTANLPPDHELSASLKQTLHWDHRFGFNTTRNERGCDEQPTLNLDYW